MFFIGDQDRALPTHAPNFKPHPFVGCLSPPKIESSHFPSCLIPSLPCVQATYWKKVSVTAFGQILPKILPVVHIFSFLIMTCLKKSLELSPLLQNSVNYLPALYRPVAPILPKMFPLLLSCLLPPPCMDCPTHFHTPTVRGKPCRWGKKPTQQQKNTQFLHQKNPPHQIAVFM